MHLANGLDAYISDSLLCDFFHKLILLHYEGVLVICFEIVRHFFMKKVYVLLCLIDSQHDPQQDLLFIIGFEHIRHKYINLL